MTINIAHDSVKALMKRSVKDDARYMIHLDKETETLSVWMGSQQSDWGISIRPAYNFTDGEGKVWRFPASIKFHGQVTPLAKQVIDVLDRFMPEERYKDV